MIFKVFCIFCFGFVGFQQSAEANPLLRALTKKAARTSDDVNAAGVSKSARVSRNAQHGKASVRAEKWPITVQVQVNRANLRRGPTTNSDIIVVLDRGQPLTLEKICGKWVRVQVKGELINGWIYSKLIQMAWGEAVDQLLSEEGEPGVCP